MRLRGSGRAGALIDALAKDARALLLALDGRQLPAEVSEAAALLAAVGGQDLEQGEDGVFGIARRVAKDRIISTVDSDARHGHQTSARGFDGYKGHVSVDPDSELIVATTVSAGNAGDAAAAAELLADDLTAPGEQPVDERPDEQPESCPEAEQPALGQPVDSAAPAALPPAERKGCDRPLSVYGDSAYGAGELVNTLEDAGAEVNCKVRPPVAPGGRFSKEAFTIDLDNGTVSCPAGQTTPLRPLGDGRIAKFAGACAGCRLAERCTTAKEGRTIYAGPTSNSSRAPALDSATPIGTPTTPPPAPRSSARSRT